MKKIIGIISLLSILFGTTALQAQSKLVLTLDSAKVYALEYNRELIKADLSIQEAQAKLWQSISQGLPQIDGKVDYNNNLGATASFAGQTIEFKPSSSAQITVSQLVFNGAYWVGIEMGKLSKRLSESSKTRSELDIKLDVATAFYNILMAEQGKDILNRNIVNIRDIFNKTEAMVKVGVAEQTDADQLSVQVLMMETSLKSTERQIELAYNMLRLQLCVDATTQIELVGELDKSAEGVNIDEMLKRTMVLENNVNYQLIKGQEDLLTKQVSLQKWSYAPTISAFYNYNYKILKPELDFAPKHTVGLMASIPIFSSGLRKNKVKEAQLGLKSIQVDIANVVDQLTIEEKQLRFNLQNAHEQYVSQQKHVEISKKVFNSMKLKYEHGLLSSLNLTIANNNYLQAENNYLAAMLSLLQAKMGLEKLLGTL